MKNQICLNGLRIKEQVSDLGFLSLRLNFDHCLSQDLKGKILLKAKKIRCETLTDEVSDEDETVNPDPDSPSTDQGSAECPTDPSKKVETILAE